MKTPIDGGPTVVICKIAPDGFFGADWGTSDQIVYSASEGLMSVSAQGGTPRLVALSASKEEAFDRPRFLPGWAHPLIRRSRGWRPWRRGPMLASWQLQSTVRTRSWFSSGPLMRATSSLDI